MSKSSNEPSNRAKPISLAPLNPDYALAGAMQVPPPKEAKAKKRRKAKKRKKKPRKGL